MANIVINIQNIRVIKKPYVLREWHSSAEELLLTLLGFFFLNLTKYFKLFSCRDNIRFGECYTVLIKKVNISVIYISVALVNGSAPNFFRERL